MATTGILRSRRSAAQLHALASVEREIRAIDPASGRKYLRDFRDAYRSYEKVLDPGDVRARNRRSRNCSGRRLPCAAEFAALSGVAPSRSPSSRQRPSSWEWRRFFPATSTFWMNGSAARSTRSELRQRIRFDLDWGYDWAPFYDLLSAARDHGAPVYGLDCMPREDLRKIGARDRHAADKIAELRRLHPDALSWCCSASRISRRNICLPCFEQRLPDEARCSPFCKMSTRSTGAPPEKRSDHVEAVQVRKTSSRECSLRLQRHAAGKIRKLPPLPRPLGAQ